jgi:tryptophan synthase beta subunit
MYEAVNRYTKVVDEETITQILEKAEKLKKRLIVCNGSRYQGGSGWGGAQSFHAAL